MDTSTKFRSEQHGNVEVGVVTHNGREYKALGAVVSDKYVTGYLGKRVAEGCDDSLLTNWNGDVIGTYRITRTWRTPHSHYSSTMNQVYAVVNGHTYTGRSAGEGMVFHGKRVAFER